MDKLENFNFVLLDKLYTHLLNDIFLSEMELKFELFRLLHSESI